MTDPRWEALRKAAQEVRDCAARYQCSDALCCGDPACVAAGHHDEHETTSDGEGWCCGHDECHCIPACSGMAPHVCQEVEWMQTTVETLDAALAALEEPAPADTGYRGDGGPVGRCAKTGGTGDDCAACCNIGTDHPGQPKELLKPHTCDPEGPRDLNCPGCSQDYWGTQNPIQRNSTSVSAPSVAPDRTALVAEVAALRAEVEEARRSHSIALHEGERFRRERDAAEAALATERARALEEAAQVVDEDCNLSATPRAYSALFRASARIRAMSASPPPAPAPKDEERKPCRKCHGTGQCTDHDRCKCSCNACQGTGRAPRAEEGDK